MEIINLMIASFLTIIALGLTSISLLSYKRYRNIKMLIISVAFFLFFVKGFFYSITLFFSDLKFLNSIRDFLIVDVFILFILYIASMKR